MSKSDEEIGLEDFVDLEDFETLPCNWTYVAVCILMPMLSGQLNAFHFAASMLHYEDMGWPIFRAGLAYSCGFVSRVFFQQVILHSGYWIAVPLGLVHLVFAVLAIVYTTSEWVIFAELVCIMGLDPNCAIEGISFDSFGASEIQARQASSTSLSFYTIASSLSVTVGGIVYDASGWRGVAVYHALCQGSLVVLLMSQPGCRRSFRETFFPNMDEIEELETRIADAETPNVKDADFVNVMPAKPRVTLPGVVEEFEVEDPADDDGMGGPNRSIPLSKARSSAISTGSSPLSKARKSAVSRTSKHSAVSHGSRFRPSSHSRNSVRSSGTNGTSGTAGTNQSAKSGKSDKSDKTDNTKFTSQTKITRKTWKTNATGRTAKTAGTFLTHITSFSTAGQDFSCHFGTKNAVQPVIAGATRKKGVARDQVDDDEEDMAEASAMRVSIPKDLRLPAFFIVLNAFLNNSVYALEFCTFAIFFKQVHNWNEATLASMAQTAGDLVAAISMQVIPHFFEEEYDLDEAGCFKRLWHKLTSKPYNLSFLLATWVLFNLGMLSPLLPLAIVAQIFMGTTYVYSSKWTTEMNLFYSLGDQKVFMSLQVLCRNAEAIGGSLAGVVGTWLYTIDPLAPFVFTTGLSVLVFFLYTVGFCSRLGCNFDDIETAEAKRSRRRGVRRVSSWLSDRATLKSGSTARSTQVAEEQEEVQNDIAPEHISAA